MSLRSTWLVFALVAGLAAGCGGGSKATTKGGGKEPTTAKEKQLQEAKAAGEIDGPNAKWGKWRYTGDRNDCYFVLGKKCFKTEAAACQTARCKAPSKCKSTGAGPATIVCK